ncbi:MAG: hypothetical protein FJ240_13030 [Nitrospira sp.]|nr:hypothetical protein [Nitrospira sp.]
MDVAIQPGALPIIMMRLLAGFNLSSRKSTLRKGGNTLEREGLIKIADGKTKYGNVSIYVREKLYTPYIFVFHQETEKPLHDNSDFADDVIGVLIKNGKLENSGTYLLICAGLGMQGRDIVVYESLAHNGKDIIREFSIAHGAVELSIAKAGMTLKMKASDALDHKQFAALEAGRKIENFSIQYVRSSKKDEYEVDDGEGIYTVDVRHMEDNTYLECDCLDYAEQKYCDHAIAIAKLFIEPRLKEYPEEREFEVAVLRIAYGSRKIRVKAKSQFEAEQKALNEAGDYEFSEHDADYEIESVLEVSSDSE